MTYVANPQVTPVGPSVVVPAAGAVAARRFVTAARTQAGAGAYAIGVSGTAATAAGQLIEVEVGEILVVAAGAAIALGAVVASDEDGRAVTHSSGAKLGVALEAVPAPATGDARVVRILFRPGMP